jgi:sugar diacid utilization regulator
MSEMSPGAGFDASPTRQQSSLRALLELSTVMTPVRDEAEILRQTTAEVPSVCDCRAASILLDGAWRPAPPEVPDLMRLEAQLAAPGLAGGPVVLPGVAWAWAYPLASLVGAMGLLVVTADAEPEESQQFLLGLLAQQAASALANARLHRQEQATAARERSIAEDQRTTNLALERSVHAAETAREALQRRLDIHDRLARIAVAGEGLDGIAQAVHQLTGLAVAIEDPFGTLMAWAGPDRPDPYPKSPPHEREELINTVLGHHGRALQRRDRVVAVAQFRDDVLGVIAVIDPGETWAEVNRGALEHGATVLALELAHMRRVAEVELRLGRDLVEELLAGGDLDGILERFRAIGYDLDRRHRVVVLVVTCQRSEGDTSFQAVRRAARDTSVGSLLVARDGRIALLADADADWESFRSAVVAELGPGGGCRAGVGGLCSAPADFATSHHEALLALNVQARLGGPEQVSRIDDLGVYSLLSESADLGSIERFVQRWLGALREYDSTKGADLVRTLTSYLECGGSYDTTASMLSIHRSSVRYRLGRIRHISGHDLADADTRFNLQLATRAWSTVLAMQNA